jgi:type IV secretory pathway VirJ component
MLLNLERMKFALVILSFLVLFEWNIDFNLSNSESHFKPNEKALNYLPIVLFPSALKDNLTLAFFISGDGGWNNFDNTICKILASKGISSIGLDAQKYFWNEKKPKTAAVEIESCIINYMEQWNKNSCVIIGYSFGACVAPFIANNFSRNLKNSISCIYCISPDKNCDFEIHISDMLSFNTNEKYDVVNELKQIANLKPVCLFGNQEDLKTRKHFEFNGIKIETLPGNHHYNEDFEAVASLIYKGIMNKN